MLKHTFFHVQGMPYRQMTASLLSRKPIALSLLTSQPLALSLQTGKPILLFAADWPATGLFTADWIKKVAWWRLFSQTKSVHKNHHFEMASKLAFDAFKPHFNFGKRNFPKVNTKTIILIFYCRNRWSIPFFTCKVRVNLTTKWQ